MIKTKMVKINNEGIKLSYELMKAKLELCLKYTPQPAHLTLNYLSKHFKDIEIIYRNTRYLKLKKTENQKF